MQLQRLLKFFGIIILGSAVLLLTSCAHWHSGADDMADVNAAADDDSSQVETAGLLDNALKVNNADVASTESDDIAAEKQHTYYFDFDKSDLRAADKAAITADAHYLINHMNLQVLIEGHTDPRGSREYNIALGERRAKTIAALLMAEGVGSTRIKTISYGAEKLSALGHAEADYQLDRRGVVIYLKN
jgi:peptidoglycan-associated lipoprotein